MVKPEEVEFKWLLLAGIFVMLLLAVSLIVFFILYQKRLLAQQLHLREVESEYQKQLLVSNIRGQEKERERIGRDLHDEIGSSLSTAKLFVNQINVAQADSKTQALSLQIKEILTNTIQNVRSVSQNLLPSVLEKFGLENALNELTDLTAVASGLNINLEIHAIPVLEYQNQLAIYRIVQELLNNTVKHAEASNVNIKLYQENDKFYLIFCDDGKGFDWGAIKLNPRAGVGLKSIEARVSMLGGQLSIARHEDAKTYSSIIIDLIAMQEIK